MSPNFSHSRKNENYEIATVVQIWSKFVPVGVPQDRTWSGPGPTPIACTAPKNRGFKPRFSENPFLKVKKVPQPPLDACTKAILTGSDQNRQKSKSVDFWKTDFGEVETSWRDPVRSRKETVVSIASTTETCESAGKNSVAWNTLFSTNAFDPILGPKWSHFGQNGLTTYSFWKIDRSKLIKFSARVAHYNSANAIISRSLRRSWS